MRQVGSRSNRPEKKASPDALSTRVLARAIGVSESSIKRWVDDGTIRSGRTAGGHRRIARTEAIRFVRETHAEVLHPDLLGLVGTEGRAPALHEAAPPLPSS